MKLPLLAFGLLLLLNSTLCSDVFGQESPKPTAHPIDQLLPAETQGCIHIPHLPEFVENWNETQLGKLGNDSRMKPFWDAQRAEFQKRFADAGWQLNLKASELFEISTGQAGIAWVAQPQNARLPYAVCLVMDITGQREKAAELLARVDEDLKKRGATSKDSQVAGTAVREYGLPPQAGETIIRNSFYSLTETQLFATDDLSLLSNLIDANKKGKNDNALVDEKIYQEALAQLTENVAKPDLQYFVRPVGFAKALRSISGRSASGQTDMLKVLENQGFGKISAVIGRVKLLTDSHELLHEAFVSANTPLPEPVQILDFPNAAAVDLPVWVSKDASSVTSFTWNANEAFWKAESIVDEIANGPGTFKEVIQSIQNDPVGPRIDIRNDVLKYLTNQIFVVTDTIQPITVDSRRALIAIQVNDPENVLKAVLDRAMENEPDAVPYEHQGFKIWKVTRDEGEFELDLESDGFGGFNANKDSAAETETEEDPPLLNNWAIAKHQDYLFFASHSELIEEVIDATSSGEQKSAFFDQPDVQTLIESMETSQSKAGWRIVRTDKSFEMQYELFHRDELPQSKTIIATLLDRILRPRDKAKEIDQKVKGDLLPDFNEIREFLRPMAYTFMTKENGWSIRSFIAK